ncbi:hypothetical protein [Limnochorda pilosa]|uniref:Uncharacterized protein n=1 Tax=Limnochorda pilosa TaxID=1555112 RepID=A0A0K2SPM5_LIMPI|nr:hypothetical protein [Limnochorda pilosa]BAS29051.1 hypothetical protein LIP_3234 [Limnochorda pilosa]
MRQDPDRHTLLAYFPSRAQAERAKRALEGEGFQELQIDRVSRYGTESASILTNPLTGNFTSLANLTLGSQDAGEDEGVLMAADPAASGLAENVGVREKGYLLTIVTGQERVERARVIAEREGGEV